MLEGMIVAVGWSLVLLSKRYFEITQERNLPNDK